MASPDDFNLLETATRECPFNYLKTIREQQPVYFMEELGAYYVSTYEDVRFIKKHPEIFSNNIFELGARRGSERSIAEEYRAEHGWARVSTLQRTDPPVHTSYRKLINNAFTVSRVRKMTPYIETVVNDLLDTIVAEGDGKGGSCDFVWDFAVPLPCIVIADQLGVPRDRIWDLKRWSDAMLAPGGGFVDEAAALECGKQVVQAQHFFAQVIAARRDKPEDDIITDLVHNRIEDPHTGETRSLTMPELQDLLDQLLTGGNETTTNAIGSALMLLLQRPGSIQRMREDPKLLRNFVEEALRFETPVLHLWRVTTADVELSGVKIPKGSSIAVGYASANRDARVFPEAEEFMLERSKAGAHLAFGSGPHHCPGAALARQEMFSTFTILLKRLGNITLANPQDPFHHIPSSFLRGLEHLHINFQVAHPERWHPQASVYG